MSEYACNFCNSKFSTKSNLNVHQKTAKKCLSIQNIENSEFICNYCNKIFAVKKTLNNHKCPNKELIIQKDNEIKALLDVINQLKDINVKKDNEIKALVDEINRLKDDEIEFLKEKIEKHENQIGKIAEIGVKKHTNTNYKINQNILNQLSPYDITREKIDKIVQENFTDGHLIMGNRGIVQIAEKNILTDREGKKKLVCTDVSRRIFVGKDDEGNQFKDPDCVNFLNDYIPSVEKKSFQILKEYIETNPDDINVITTLEKNTIDIQKIKETPSLITTGLAKVLSV